VRLILLVWVRSVLAGPNALGDVHGGFPDIAVMKGVSFFLVIPAFEPEAKKEF
jgi:hypothetical protein